MPDMHSNGTSSPVTESSGPIRKAKNSLGWMRPGEAFGLYIHFLKTVRCSGAY